MKRLLNWMRQASTRSPDSGRCPNGVHDVAANSVHAASDSSGAAVSPESYDDEWDDVLYGPPYESGLSLADLKYRGRRRRS